jgi:septum formation protein
MPPIFPSNSSLILASASPRRKELLSRLGIPFEVKALDTPEPLDQSPPSEQVVRLALAKLKAFRSAYPTTKRPILCADTCVDIDGRILGKPSNEEEAEKMLFQLSGRWHRVITALALGLEGQSPIIKTAVTEVRFAELTKAEVDWYIKTEEWQDVAGAYRIQEQGALLIEEIRGCFYNVMGLPLRLVYGMLRDTVPDVFSNP